MQFLCTVLLVGFLVLLTRLRWDWATATNASAARSDMDTAVKTTSVGDAEIGVSASSRENSWVGFFLHFFDRPSWDDIEVIMQQMAAEKDHIRMEDLAKAGKSFKVRPTHLCKTLLTRSVDTARSHGARISDARPQQRR